MSWQIGLEFSFARLMLVRMFCRVSMARGSSSVCFAVFRARVMSFGSWVAVFL